MREFINIVENADQQFFHGTTAPITDPFRPFSHFGTRIAALQRAAVVARRIGRKWEDGVWSNDLNASIYLYPVQIHLNRPRLDRKA